MTKPWDSTLSADTASVLSFLRAACPDMEFRSFRHLGQGWDNTIYLADEEWIFRIARRTLAIPLIEAEIRILPLLGPLLSIPIPALRHQGLFQEEYPFISYRILPGAIAAGLDLTDMERRSFLQPVTRFLNELHAIPLTEDIRQRVLPDQMGRVNIPKRTQQIRSKIYVVRELGMEFDNDLLEDLFRRLATLSTQRPYTLVHGDLHARNVLIEDRSTLSGIIDWGDVHLGDPAKDMAFPLSFFNASAFGEFKEQYTLFDADTFCLSTMAAISNSCHLAEYALDIKEEGQIRECRTIFRNIQENYLAYK